MMKYIALVFITMSTFSFAQQKNEYKLQQQIFTQAVTYGDLGVATNAVYKMMALKPQNRGLKDTLTYLYFSSLLPSCLDYI